MKELDLPAISVDHSVVPPASVDHTKVGSAGEPGGKPQSEAAGKFQLGETLPVVPSRIVARILRGDFVDMAELGEEHLELELRRATEGEEGKHTSKGRLRTVPDLLTWAQCFCQYAGVVVMAHPSKARDLWAYLAMMLSGAHRSGGDWWRAYDSRFRQQLPSLEKAEFGKLDQALYTRSILVARAGGGPAPPSQSLPEWQGPPGPKRKRSMACFAWDDGRNCVSTPCRFTHVCFRCGGDHRKGQCGPAAE